VLEEDRLDRAHDLLPGKAEPLDDGRRDVDLRVPDPLPVEPADDVPRQEPVIVRPPERPADIPVQLEERAPVPQAALAVPNRLEIRKQRDREPARQPDQGGRRDAPLQVKVELGLPKAPEVAKGLVTVRHVATSYSLNRERLWMRAAALGIDLLVLAGLPLLVTTVVVFGILLGAAEPPWFLASIFRSVQVLFVVLFLLRDAVPVLSPGKALFGLQTIKKGGGRASIADSFVRNLPLLIPIWNVVEVFAVLRRPDGRRSGDLGAGTTVVEA